MVKVENFKFNKEGIEEIRSNSQFGVNWPIVYIINNDKEAYIGETQHGFRRSKEHLINDERVKLNTIHIIGDKHFNKSAILDIESMLIDRMNADNKYKIQNSTVGQNPSYNYYQKGYYHDLFVSIWAKLKKESIVNNDLSIVENSDLFKFSPYKNLTDEQYSVVQDLLYDILDVFSEESLEQLTTLIRGNAGTGKSILALYLVKQLIDIGSNNYDLSDLETLQETYGSTHIEMIQQFKKIKKLVIGLVIPMTSLRATIKNVFKNIKGLSADMVIGPSEVLKKDYDILIVDEAHRLKKRKNLTSYGSFDNNNEKLRLDKYKGTELDWILLKSKFQILFYDNKQSVRPSDIDSSRFDELEKKKTYYLRTQMRVQGGDEYIKFVNDLLNLNIKSKKYNICKYDLKLYDDVNDMIEDIKILEKDNQLCRNIAGNAWKWASKNMSYKDAIKKNIYDIKIDNYEYIWNTTSKNWITSKSAINEIGCIHTVQGYDLNYTGVIFGNEIKYDSKNKEIYVDRDNFYDDKSKTGVHDIAELKEYILNVYNILLTRGMRGTYIYVCDEALRNYFKKSMLKIHNSSGE